jgi:hypothetical protein
MRISSEKETKMRMTTILMTVLVTILVLSATDATAKDEIYRWVDENGVVHFGDRPGGRADVEQIEIQDNRGGTYQAPSTAVAADPGEQQEPQPSYAQQLRDERATKRKEAAEEKEIIDAACKQRRQLVAQLEPSTRVMVEYEDGTVVRLDDNERLKTLDEAKAYIAENCNK